MPPYRGRILCYTSCKTWSTKIWLVLGAGLAENLTQVVFRQPFVIQDVRTQLLNCETWNFLLFIYFHHYIIITIYNSDLWCYCISSCCFVLFRDLSHKNAWLNHTIPYKNFQLLENKRKEHSDSRRRQCSGVQRGGERGAGSGHPRQWGHPKSKITKI